MPKRQKLPPEPDFIGKDQDSAELTVQNIHPLMTLSETGMTLPALKILDVYLSRINSHDLEHRYVRLERGELERLLEVVKIPLNELEKRLKNLFRVVTIRDKNKPKGFTHIALFEKAEAFQDDNGQWQVDLSCTPAAMEYIFNPENLGYLRYRLSNVVNLTSRYSYILYLYLESNQYRHSWTIGVQELKDLLRCTADTYQQFYRFNDLILKHCKKELDEKSSLKFEYETVKKGRRVVEIRFTVKKSDTRCSLPPSGQPADKPAKLGDSSFGSATKAPAFGSDQPEEQQTLYGGFQDTETDSFEVVDVLIPPESEEEHLRRLAGACDNRFSPIEMREICRIVFSHEYGSPYSTDREIQDSRVNYLSMMYTTFKFQVEYNIAHGRPIRNRFKYFLRMLENDSSYLDY